MGRSLALVLAEITLESSSNNLYLITSLLNKLGDAEFLARLQTNQPPQLKPHNIPEVQMPKINTVPIPNPFTPMPIFNQPYLPPGTQIPSVYNARTYIPPWSHK